MKQLAKVSIIIPVYKVENYIQRCLDSIVNQTYKNIEIILIDDGSPDNCPRICDDFAKKDNRIVVIHQKNKGVSAARNKGLEIANGDYITFVDSDDFINTNSIKRWVDIIEEYNADLVVSNIQKYYGKVNVNKLIWLSPIHDDITITNTEQVLKKMFLNDFNLCVVWGKLYNKRLFNNLWFRENISFGEDMLISHVLFERANSIVLDSFSGVYYNQEGESSVRSDFNLKKMDMIVAADTWVEFVKAKYPNLIDAAFYRDIVIKSNIYGDVVYWKNEDASTILHSISMNINESWNQIISDPYFSKKDIIKAYIVKKNDSTLMKLYKSIRLLLFRLEAAHRKI